MRVRAGCRANVTIRTGPEQIAQIASELLPVPLGDRFWQQRYTAEARNLTKKGIRGTEMHIGTASRQR